MIKKDSDFEYMEKIELSYESEEEYEDEQYQPQVR